MAGYSKSPNELARGKDGKLVESASAQSANYGLPIWKRILTGTTVTIGCNNIFGQDPPHSLNKFPFFAYDPTGRFLYASVTKKF